jgi:hypothetical protein
LPKEPADSTGIRVERYKILKAGRQEKTHRDESDEGDMRSSCFL